MREIPLTKGKVAFVDDEDYEWLSQFKWTLLERPNCRSRYYAYRKVNRKTTYMHREILGLKRGDSRVVDHEDNNGLNNQRLNIRVATYSQNSANIPNSTLQSLPYKGLVARPKNKWGAQIRSKETGHIWIGTFSSPEEAARAYDVVAVRLFGEFARLNCPDEKAA